MDVAVLWRQCLSCCGQGENDDDDTKLCKIALTLNCCAHHNTTYNVTDGVEEESAKEKEEQCEDNDTKQEGRGCPTKDLLQYTPSCGIRQRSKSCESLRSE